MSLTRMKEVQDHTKAKYEPSAPSAQGILLSIPSPQRYRSVHDRRNAIDVQRSPDIPTPQLSRVPLDRHFAIHRPLSPTPDPINIPLANKTSVSPPLPAPAFLALPEPINTTLANTTPTSPPLPAPALLPASSPRSPPRFIPILRRNGFHIEPRLHDEVLLRNTWARHDAEEAARKREQERQRRRNTQAWVEAAMSALAEAQRAIREKEEAVKMREEDEDEDEDEDESQSESEDEWMNDMEEESEEEDEEMVECELRVENEGVEVRDFALIKGTRE
ncbi:MAG: hypothetical protein Q9227_009507 [Pyrenula ochraceoflavens]